MGKIVNFIDNLMLRSFYVRLVVVVMEAIILLFFNAPIILIVDMFDRGFDGSMIFPILFWCLIDAFIIYVIIINNKKEYYPERYFYRALPSGLTEYHYTYFIWQRNKLKGCKESLRNLGVQAIYSRQLSIFRRYIYGNAM